MRMGRRNKGKEKGKDLNEEFEFSAAKGAEQARQQQAVVLTSKQKERAEFAKSIEKAKPIEDAVNSLSQIQGINISLDQNDHGHRLRCDLMIGYHRYNMFIEARETGYSISNGDEDGRGYYGPAVRGSDKDLKSALQSIAMIAGFTYPNKAAEIDGVIDQAIAKNCPSVVGQPQQPKRSRFKKPQR